MNYKNLKCEQIKHEHIIGLLNMGDYSELVTLEDLKKHIKDEIEICQSIYQPILSLMRKPYTLKDYCDKRKSTDLERFDYCPFCGGKIDWKKIKESDNDTISD